MSYLGDGRLAAVVDVDPDFLDLERIHVAEANVGLLEGDLSVDPAPQHAVALATAAGFSWVSSLQYCSMQYQRPCSRRG